MKTTLSVQYQEVFVLRRAENVFRSAVEDNIFSPFQYFSQEVIDSADSNRISVPRTLVERSGGLDSFVIKKFQRILTDMCTAYVNGKVSILDDDLFLHFLFSNIIPHYFKNRVTLDNMTLATLSAAAVYLKSIRCAHSDILNVGLLLQYMQKPPVWLDLPWEVEQALSQHLTTIIGSWDRPDKIVEKLLFRHSEELLSRAVNTYKRIEQNSSGKDDVVGKMLSLNHRNFNELNTILLVLACSGQTESLEKQLV